MQIRPKPNLNGRPPTSACSCFDGRVAGTGGTSTTLTERRGKRTKVAGHSIRERVFDVSLEATEFAEQIADADR